MQGRIVLAAAEKPRQQIAIGGGQGDGYQGQHAAGQCQQRPHPLVVQPRAALGEAPDAIERHLQRHKGPPGGQE